MFWATVQPPASAPGEVTTTIATVGGPSRSLVVSLTSHRLTCAISVAGRDRVGIAIFVAIIIGVLPFDVIVVTIRVLIDKQQPLYARVWDF